MVRYTLRSALPLAAFGSLATLATTGCGPSRAELEARQEAEARQLAAEKAAEQEAARHKAEEARKEHRSAELSRFYAGESEHEKASAHPRAATPPPPANLIPETHSINKNGDTATITFKPANGDAGGTN